MSEEPELNDHGEVSPKPKFGPGSKYSDPRDSKFLPGSSLEDRERGNSSDIGLANITSGATSFFKPTDKISKLTRLKNFGSRNRKKASIGVLAGTGTIGVALALFSLILPLKVEMVVQNVEKKFMASSKNAVSHETDTLVKRFILKRVIPGYSGKSCVSTRVVSKDCSAVKKSVALNPVSNLYNTWAEAKVETNLANKHGIEIKKMPDGTWRLKTPSTSGDGVDIGKDGSKIDNAFNKVGAADIRKAVREETSWYNMMTRYKAGRLLEQKYGVKRCVIACKTKDKIDAKVAANRNMAKILTVERVIMPRNQSLGIVLACFLSGCDPTTNAQPDGDPGAPSSNGEPVNPEVEGNVSQALRDFAAKYNVLDEAALKVLQQTADDIGKNGLTKYLVQKGLTKIGLEAGAQMASDAIPVVGWMNLAAKVISFGDNAGPAFKKLSYVTNAYAAVQLYSMYRTYADEIHTGNVSATNVGSWVNSLGAGGSDNPNDPKLGGNANAEQSPAWGYVMGKSPTSSAFLGNDDGAKVYAATAGGSSGAYLCNDGKPIPANQTLCDEEILGGGNNIANSVHDFLNTPGVGVITTFAKVWTGSVGKLVGGVTDILSGAFSKATDVANGWCGIAGNVIGSITTAGYCEAKSLMDEATPKITEAVVSRVIPSPFGTNMSGGRTMTMIAAGGDVAGNDFAHHGIGGRALSAQESADIQNQELSKDQQEFASLPLYDRLFSTDTQYSLISRAAIATPSSFSVSFSGMFSSIFSNIFNGFGSIFSGKTAWAATPAQTDPYGVTQYGYTQADLDKIGDPEVYWDNNCMDDASKGYQKDNSYNLEATRQIDDSTAMPKNTTTNACALIKTAVGSAGGKYNTDLLPADDLTSTTSTSAQQTQQSTTQPASGTAIDLAKQILNDPNITLQANPRLSIEAAARGEKSPGGTDSSGTVHPPVFLQQSLLSMLVSLSSGGFKYTITSLTTGTHAPTSDHYQGDAVDIGAINGVTSSGRTSEDIKLINYIVQNNLMPSGSQIGQVACGPTVSTPNYQQVNDTCNHLHLGIKGG